MQFIFLYVEESKKLTKSSFFLTSFLITSLLKSKKEIKISTKIAEKRKRSNSEMSSFAKDFCVSDIDFTRDDNDALLLKS